MTKPGALYQVFGGPVGSRARAAGWLGLPLLILLVLSTMLLGLVQKEHCRERGWNSPDQFVHACYSDLPLDYQSTGLAQGKSPYLRTNPEQNVAQPVLTGLSMWALAAAVPGVKVNQRLFFDLAGIFLALLAVALVTFTHLSSGGRPTAGILVAISPILLLSGLISLDLLGVALSMAGLWLWGRSQPVAAGVVFGLAITARTYPALLVLVLGLFALRTGRATQWVSSLLASTLTVVVLLTPWLALNSDGVRLSYRTWAMSTPGFGSIWVIPQLLSSGQVAINSSIATFLAIFGLGAAVLIAAWLCLSAQRRPTIAQISFVVVALAVLTGKSWPVQASLWLIPLAALARPRWREHALWWLTEVLYFVAIWLNLVGDFRAERGLPDDLSTIFIIIRYFGLIFLLIAVIRDIRATAPAEESVSDPLAGPFRGQPDVLRLFWSGPQGAVKVRSNDPLGLSESTLLLRKDRDR